MASSQRNLFRVIIVLLAGALCATVVLAVVLVSGPARAATGSASFSGDFPDPDVVQDGSVYFAFATQYGHWDGSQNRFVCGNGNPADPGDPSPCRNIQRLTSSAPHGPWTVMSDALPVLPSWAQQGATWAPSVIQVGTEWLMFYTVHNRLTRQQCLAIATASSLTASFTPTSGGPLLCDAIDPAPFRDANGRLYLHWQSGYQASAAIYGQQLSTDRFTLVGPRSKMLVRDQPWEGPTVEGPFMVGVPSVAGSTGETYSTYDLFYSGNDWTTGNYAIGYAECAGPLGGCRKVTTAGPWYADNNPADAGTGPGGQSLFVDASSQLQMAYHGWLGRPGYVNDSARAMWVNRISYTNGSPRRPIPPGTPVADYYAGNAAVRAAVGNPVGTEYSVGGGTAQNYTAGRIYWSPATGPHEVHGAILAEYLAVGGPTGVFGFPVTDEIRTPDGIGRYNHFANGASIYWTPSTGAHEVHGAIRATWAATGWERGPLGYPTTDETSTPDGIGRYNHFSKAGSIYWTPATGANAIYGAIRATWASLGWERSRLGYPTTSEYGIPGGRRSDFQGGSITWTASTGAVHVVYR